MRILEGGLIACICGAVLSFGATEPPFFAGVQVAVFLLVGLMVWREGAEKTGARLPWKGPALLLTYVLTQSLVLSSQGYIVPGPFLTLLTYVGIFYLAVYVCHNENSRYRLLMALIALGLVEALYGLVQYLSGWQQIFSYKKVFYTTQATGTYINPNHFAGFLEMVLPLAFAFTVHLLERDRRVDPITQQPRHPRSESERIAALLFFFFASLLLFAGILFSRSRMGIFSASGAIVVMGTLWISSSWRRSVAVLALVGFLAGASLLGLWIGLEPIVERYRTVEGDHLTRLSVWKDTLCLIKAHALFGTGLGTFPYVYPRVQTTLLSRFVNHAHNDYLEITAELGILGAGLVFGLVLTVLGKGVFAFYRLPQKRNRFLVLGSCGSILALLFHSFADFNLYIPANALVLAVILGVTQSANLNTGVRGKDGRRESQSSIRWDLTLAH